MQTIKVIVLGINIFAVLGLISLISNPRQNKIGMIEALEDIRDTKEFIREDLFNERIDSAAATSYINVLDDAEDKLIQLLK